MDMRPGINHVEWWVKDWAFSGPFYTELFALLGWKALAERAFSSGQSEIYFREMPHLERQDGLGPRHFCFQAVSREMVDRIHDWLVKNQVTVLRGPLEQSHYSPGYYAVDFLDPDGYILEAAYTPHMEL
jgi:catechol 2,3-dioxygenase-like lactoylglutathione lyase family enzyme